MKPAAFMRIQFPSFLCQPLSPFARMVAFILGFTLLFLCYSDSVRRQWDFAVYYLASAAIRSGENPYDSDTLMAISQTVDGVGYGGLGYLYPPHLARLLYPLSHGSYFLASFIWMVLKCFALEFSLFLILSLLKIRIHPLSLLLIHGAAMLYRPIGLDMSAGNIAIFESVLILGALAAWTKKKYGVSAFLLILGGSLKGSSLLLALYPLHLRDKPFLRALIITALGFSAVLLIDYPVLIECFRFFQSPKWKLLWDEQVQSFYNCSSTTVILRTFSDTYFAEPLWPAPYLSLILIPLFPITVFAAACYGIYRHNRADNADRLSGVVLGLLLCTVLLLPPRLAGYTLALTFMPVVCLVTRSIAEKRWFVLTLMGLGLGLIQCSIPPNHVPAGITQLLIDKDFFGLLLIFISLLLLCITTCSIKYETLVPSE